MNERNKSLYLCLFLTIFGVVQVCNGYSSNTIKEYSSSKDYLVSSTSAASRFEDNEIRGESGVSLFTNFNSFRCCETDAKKVKSDSQSEVT